MTSGIDAALVPEGQIAGTVTDSATHAAIAGVCVQVYDGSGSVVASAHTDASGAYTTPRLASGAHRVGFTDCNSLGYYTQYYKDKWTLASADPVSVTTGATTSKVDDALSLPGNITGKVIRSATGTPVVCLCVAAYNRNGQAENWALTDSHGNYTIPLGVPGSYRVGFYTVSCGSGGFFFVPQYYKDKATLARPIHLRSPWAPRHRGSTPRWSSEAKSPARSSEAVRQPPVPNWSR
jgi:hypothetical protein